jgi:hypothetical protein
MMSGKLHTLVIGLLMAGVMALPAYADRDSDNRDGDFSNKRITTDKPGLREKLMRDEHREPRTHVDEDRSYRERGYKLDTRYHHNHYYPPRGRVIRTLPKHYRVVPYRGVNYYFNAGIWYRRSGVNFTVVIPPPGVFVPVLPPYYTTVWVGATPYYYAGGVYYIWRPSAHGYEVVKAPDDDEVVVESSVPQELFVYPKEGQSKEQQAKDRYECYRWAVDQTGFDPTMPGGDVPVEDNAAKRADYQRAETACLEGRGYSVK